MDKKGNFRRNVLVISVAIAVVLGMTLYATQPGEAQWQVTSPQLLNITLANGSALAAYYQTGATIGNYNDTEHGACTPANLSANVRRTVGGTIIFYINTTTWTTGGATNMSGDVGTNISNYTWAALRMVYGTQTGAAATNYNATFQNISDATDGNMTLMAGAPYCPTTSFSGGTGSYAGTCIPYLNITTGASPKNNNDSRMWYKSWDTAGIFAAPAGGASSWAAGSAKCVWVSLVVYNGTGAMYNGTPAAVANKSYGFWIDIDNNKPAVGPVNATYFHNTTDTMWGAANILENYTVELNETNITDPIFGSANLNEVWVKISAVGGVKWTAENYTKGLSAETRCGYAACHFPTNVTGAADDEGGWSTSFISKVNDSYLAPGYHYVYWCANDTVNNVNCSSGAPEYIFAVNTTQLEEAYTVDSGNDIFLNISFLNGTNHTAGSAHYGRDFHFGAHAGVEILNITTNAGGATYSTGSAGVTNGSGLGIGYGEVSNGAERYNFTYTMLDYGNETIEIIGLKFNTSLANTLNNINATNITEGSPYVDAAVKDNTSDQITGIVSYLVEDLPAIGDLSNELQQHYYLMGRIVFNTTYNNVFNCSGATECTEMYACNTTPSIFPNGTASFINESGGGGVSIAQNGSCYQYETGKTVIYSRHFSGFAAGNDTTGPVGELIIGDNEITSTESTAITCTASDYYRVDSISISVEGHQIIDCSEGTAVSSCSETYNPPTTGVKTVVCKATDTNSQQTEFTGTITVRAQTSGGGGGGGGGATPSTTTTTNLKAGEEKSVAIGADTGIDSVDLKTIAAATNVVLTTSALSGKPASANTITTEKVYKYVEIKTENLDPTNIAKATVNFKVPNAWINENSLTTEKVSLYRYVDNKWTELDTQVEKEDTSNAYFEASTPGFSYFAIAEAGAGTQTGTATTPTEPVSAGTQVWVWYVVGALVLGAAGVAAYYFFFSKK